MSFLARLTFDSKSYYTVLDAQFEVTQGMGRDNLPNRKPEIGLIHLTLESANSLELFEWAILPNLTKSGSIVFSSRDFSDSLKTLQFSDAFCVKYKEHFVSDGSMPMRVMISISCHSISLHGAALSNHWVGFKEEGGSAASQQSVPATQEAGSDSDIPSFRP